MGITVTFLVDKLPDVIKRLPDALAVRLLEVADAGRADAAARAPRRTGYMAEHVTVQPTSATSVEIRAEAPYSGYVDMGTRHMPARPWFTPAMLGMADRFNQSFRDLESLL